MSRAEEPGWIEIGKRCSAGRRSLWVRYTAVDPERPNVGPGNIDFLDLCAGREGDDAYVRIDKTNPQFEEILDLINTARFAAET